MTPTPDWSDRAADIGDATDDVLEDFDEDERQPANRRATKLRREKAPRKE